MKKFARLYLVFVFALLYLPIFYLMFYSFNQGGDMNGFTGFTLEHFQTLFEDTRLMTIFLHTFVLAFSSALIAYDYWDIWGYLYSPNPTEISKCASLN